ncbi:hypothetical protein [Agromyces sp. Soil535]|uniref:hypothetical protein n=1 Tax=Agromyces sp. Soil535 TaxID=1736390 RepID=UPI0006FEE810|nr:hypothetical protein [Agromyces sp. Soil535]KRE21876.1 hypothetical protein ASG80_12420 [Agromyces sp. Soil535]
MHRYQPFHADSADLVYERQADHNNPTFEVVTLGYLLAAVEQPSTHTIVLTGDAGHGKTSLCAHLLVRLGLSNDEASRAVETAGRSGHESVGRTANGRPIYMLKDLSDFAAKVGAERLVALLDPPQDGVAIICANEGQLRNCVAEDQSGRARIVVDTLGAGIARGAVQSEDAAVVVINLNYQSVAPDRDSDGLVDWAVKNWSADKRSWQVCKRCDAQAVCPIFANHQALSDTTSGPPRRRAIRDLFSAAEQTGAVITTRQALSVLAHGITGGLTCKDVHRRYGNSRADTSWQYPFQYHQALFGDRLSVQQRQQVPAIAALRRLDPGMVSRRQVDDALEPEAVLVSYLPPVPGVNGQRIRTAQDAQREANALRDLYTFLRRANFFDADRVDRFARLGLSAGDAFVAIRSNTPDSGKTAVRDVILKGLEAVQGVHRVGNNPDFLVLDPAFFSHRTRAAVVSRRVTSKPVQVVDQVTQWMSEVSSGGAEPVLHEAVEWINRAIYVRIPGPHGKRPVAVEVDLLRFELLNRWAAGLRSGTQHEAEIRGLTSTLSALAEAASEREEIQVLVGATMRKLMIDVGDQIRSVRA